jgi:hypothetical protein
MAHREFRGIVQVQEIRMGIRRGYVYNVGGGTAVTAGGVLASTGPSHIGTSLLVAMLLLAVGGLMLAFGYRRRRAEARNVGL